MSLDKLRYFLTDHKERIFIYVYKNLELLVHPSIDDSDLLNRVYDDINLFPEIQNQADEIEIKFYRYSYNEQIYVKDELLAFIFASINRDFDVIRGIDIETEKTHFWLKYNDVVYDPSLAIITKEDIFFKRFRQLNEIKNKDVIDYLRENNNLYKFYQKGIFKKFKNKINKKFSINFINKIIKDFNENINKQYMLNDEKIKELKEFFFMTIF